MKRALWLAAAGIHAFAIALNAYALALTGSGVCAFMVGLSIVLGAHCVTKARNT
jgi:hypothetical protein